MRDLEIDSLDWKKMNGLLPAVIQHAKNGKVLMLGYMNQESLIASLTSGQLTLYSRSRKRLWRKGESSGNSMALQHISADCDNDSLLIQVIPKGAACHLGYNSCYHPALNSSLGILDELMEAMNDSVTVNHDNCQTTQLLGAGIYSCSQKVGEKAIETVVAAVSDNKENLLKKSADLVFYLLILLKASALNFYEVLEYLPTADPNTNPAF